LISQLPYEETIKRIFGQQYRASKGDEVSRLPEVKVIYDSGWSQTNEQFNQVITVEKWDICPDLPAATG